MSEKWKMSLEWFDKCTVQDFKNGATISAIRDVIKENERLRKIEAALKRQEESHRSIAICLLSPTQQGVESCRKQALRFADEALAALAGEGGGK